MDYLRLLTVKSNYMQKSKTNFSSFQRFLRPFCKTNFNTRDNSLHVRLKNYQYGIRIQYLKNDVYQINFGHTSEIKVSVFAENNQQLLKKILKHNYLTFKNIPLCQNN